MHAQRPLQVLLLTVTTLVSGVFGACVGFVVGLSTPIPCNWGAETLWALSWTVIGALQGACVAAALHRGAALQPVRSLILAAGGLLTTLTALHLWESLGAGARVSLAIALGLSAMCAAPLGAHLLSRRKFAPALPV